MPISPIGGGAGAFQPIEMPKIGGIETGDDTSKANFGDKLTSALENVQGAQSKADDLSMQVATGQLTDIHDYMIAANQAEIATQLTVAVRNKAVEAFNQVMNMSV
jgi:flagellar hook-basal body complex protein FliE